MCGHTHTGAVRRVALVISAGNCPPTSSALRSTNLNRTIGALWAVNDTYYVQAGEQSIDSFCVSAQWCHSWLTQTSITWHRCTTHVCPLLWLVETFWVIRKIPFVINWFNDPLLGPFRTHKWILHAADCLVCVRITGSVYLYQLPSGLFQEQTCRRVSMVPNESHTKRLTRSSKKKYKGTQVCETASMTVRQNNDNH